MCLTRSLLIIVDTRMLALQEAVQAKGRASAALQQAQQQQGQTAQHLSLLTQQLAEERQEVAALSANLDSLQAEHNRYKTQVMPRCHHCSIATQMHLYLQCNCHTDHALS